MSLCDTEPKSAPPDGIAAACLVRFMEIPPVPLLLTTAADFKIYRRLGRRVIPTRMP